jgi:membrane protein
MPSAAVTLVKTAYREWSDASASRLGAALAYYTIFSLAPLLLIAVAVAGLVFGEEAARERLLAELGQTVGEKSLAAIREMLAHASQLRAGPLPTLGGLAVALFGAVSLFTQLQDALNTIWRVEPRPGRRWWPVVRKRFMSFLMVLALGLLLLASLLVGAALAVVNRFLASYQVPGGTGLWDVVNAAVSFGLIMLLFALIYKVLPDVQLTWRDVWVGAFVTALLFTAGRYLIGLYLGRFHEMSAYGAAGSLVVLLVWVYYSAQVFLFGAAFTKGFANLYGTRPPPEPLAQEKRPGE